MEYWLKHRLVFIWAGIPKINYIPSQSNLICWQFHTSLFTLGILTSLQLIKSFFCLLLLEKLYKMEKIKITSPPPHILNIFVGSYGIKMTRINGLTVFYNKNLKTLQTVATYVIALVVSLCLVTA